MTRIHHGQTNFTAGELSPLLHGRGDLAKYANGAAELTNMLVLPHGGATRRPGTRFVSEAGGNGGAVRLAPFRFSTEQAYVLEFGERSLRIYRDGGRIEAGAVSAAISNGGFDATVAGWDDLSNGGAAIDHRLLGGAEAGSWGAATATAYVLGDGLAGARHVGLRFRNAVAGTVTGVRIPVSAVAAALNAVAALYTDDGGSPGARIGEDSDATALDAAGDADFAWSSGAPELAADTDYWVVLSDIDGGSGQAELYAANSQGAGFVSGRADTVAGIGDGTGSFSTAHDWRIRVTVRPDGADGVLSLDGAAGGTAAAEQAVALAEAGARHLLRFRVRGLPGDAARLRIGTASGGTDLVDDREAGPGWHVAGFSTAAASAFVGFRRAGGGSVQIDDVAIVPAGAVELATPWGAKEAFALNLAQSADVLYIAHPDHPPHKLLRYGHDEWSLVEAPFADGPWLDENTGATTLQPAATTGAGVAVTASGTEGINGGRGFLATDVGRALRLAHGGSWGWGVIAAREDATHVRVDIRRAFAGTGAVTAWRLGAWSATTGWPTCVTFHEQRLCWAGERSRPQTFRTSKTNDFENMAPTTPDGTVEDDAAMTYAIAANEVNAIGWMSSTRSLVLGTAGGTWPVRANSLDDPLTPANIQIKRANTFGASARAPVEVGDAVLYLSPSTRKLRELAFLIERDNFAAPDLTILAEHAIRPGIVQMAHAQEPWGTVWAVRGDGALLAMTYEREHEVVAWTRHILGGTCAGGPARVESVAAIPAPDGARTQIWLAVCRTVGGQTRRFVEVLSDGLPDDAPPAGAVFVDCGLTLDAPLAITGASATDPVRVTVPGHGVSAGDPVDIEGVAGMTALNGRRFRAADPDADSFALADMDGTDIDGTGFAAWVAGGTVRKAVGSVAGLDHLEGETVAILADGTVRPEQVVTGGAVSLDPPASRVHVGWGYASTVATLPLDPGLADGSARGRTRRIDRITLRLHRSAGGTAGPDAARQDALPGGYGTVMDRAADLVSGEVTLPFAGGFDTHGRIVIRQDAPLPLTVLSVTARAEIASE